MSYARNLTFNLRLRGLSEPEIAEVIDKVRAHEAAAGAPPEAEFGTAEEYAKQFPKKKRRTRGTLITTIGAAISIAHVLLAVLLMLLFRVDIRGFVGPNALLPVVVLALASVLAGFLTDYFQPRRATAQALGFLNGMVATPNQSCEGELGSPAEVLSHNLIIKTSTAHRLDDG